MPVADRLERARVHMKARLAGIKDNNQNGKEHHVGGQEKKDEKPNAVEEFAWTAAFIFPVVISAAAPSTGRPAVNGRFAADSRLFPFRFSGGGGKNGRHKGHPWK